MMSQLKRYITCHLIGIGSIVLFINSAQATTLTLTDSVCVASSLFSCTNGRILSVNRLIAPTCQESCSLSATGCAARCAWLQAPNCQEECDREEAECLSKCP